MFDGNLLNVRDEAEVPGEALEFADLGALLFHACFCFDGEFFGRRAES